MFLQNKEMEYQDVENYILDVPKFTKKNQFHDTQKFYDFLGRPGEKQKIIHVAGTNGKGSVCAFLESILLEHGYSCGLFTSPHLITMRERMRINQIDISENEFVECFFKLQKSCQEFQKINSDNDLKDYHPTFFELLFFMTMLWFEEKKPDYIILETGLGGLLDTTNVVDNKELCIITKLAFDHMEYLGDTLAKIAENKAGIIKNGVPVVFLETGECSDDVIKARARECNSELDSVPYSTIDGVKSHEKSIDFLVDFKYYGCKLVQVCSGGVYQALNATLAIKGAEILLDTNLQLDNTIKAIEHTNWPCRMEEIVIPVTNTHVTIDGAHNPDGMEAFLKSVSMMSGKKQLLFAVVKDKNQRQMIKQIVDSNLFDRIVVTTVGGYRASDISEIVGMFETEKFTGEISAVENVQTAFAEIEKKASDSKAFVAGSLYLAGEIRKICM